MPSPYFIITADTECHNPVQQHSACKEDLFD